MYKREFEPPRQPARVYEWYNERGVHSAFQEDPSNTKRFSRIEFGSITSGKPTLIIRFSDGVNFHTRPAMPEEGKKFLDMVEADIPDARILGDLRMVVARLGAQSNNPRST